MKNTETARLLIADIGGTHARFAVADETKGYTKQQTLQCADFSSANSAIRHYLKLVNEVKPDIICIAAAGPVVDECIRFTNNNWTLSVADLEAEFDGAQVSLLNDFEAVAYALALLKKEDCLPLGSTIVSDLGSTDFKVGVLGPGTGLGVAGLTRRGGHIHPISGEGGHCGFAPETPLQKEVLDCLGDRFDRVFNERLLSGPGIVNIYQALCRIRSESLIQTSPAEVFSQALAGNNPIAGETIKLFFEILGQVAGDLALTLGAYDGIYIAGGIVRREPSLIMGSQFRTAFERKGHYRQLMQNIPTQLILHPQPGLLGASYYARQMSLTMV